MKRSVWGVFCIALVTSLSSTPSVAGGWDYNLTHRCVATTGNPGDPNYYEERTGCPDQGVPEAPPPRRWQVAVQTESTYGNSCVGPNTRSHLINGAGSPVKLEWLQHASDLGPNWTIRMLVDQSTYTLPASCGPDTWTWFSFQDHNDGGGGPLPNGAVIASSHAINYSSYEPSSNDGSRLIASAMFWYNQKAHFIDIDIASKNYTYPPVNSPGLLLQKTLVDGSEYVVLDGPSFGVTVTPNADSFVYIPWYSILQTVLNNHWFPDWSAAPADRSAIATGTVELAVEVRNRAIASAWHTNFRIAP